MNDSPPTSSSVPRHFRYIPNSFRSSSPFYNPGPEHDDPAHYPAPTVSSSKPKTRLEVLKSWEVNLTVISLYAASFFALIYVLVTLHRTSYTWRSHHTIPPFTSVERVFRFFLEFAYIALPLYFVLNLFISETVTHEQIWTCVLLAVGLLATNPLTRNYPFDANSAHLIFTDAIYIATIYLYLLIAVHSYRIMDNRRIHSLSFYAPKFGVALTYFLVKTAAGLNAAVSLGLIPFSRILTWFLLATSGRISLRLTVPVALMAIMDTIFGFWLVREITLTTKFLTTVPYVETRAKQLGFRCFVYQTLAFCINIIGLSIIITAFLPRSYIYSLYDHPHHVFLLEPPVARLGLAFVYFTWTLILAYVNLPPRAFLPFLKHLIPRARDFLSKHRISAWLGMAEISVTDEPEDTPSEDGATTATLAPTTTASVLEPGTIPMRYRHRELYEVTPPHIPMSPLTLNSSTPSPHLCLSIDSLHDSILLAHPHVHRYPSEPVPARPVNISMLSKRFLEPQSSSSLYQRLRMRKNLFVMETQVLLANCAYLSYIPGNPNEELPQDTLEDMSDEDGLLSAMGHPISVPADLDELRESEATPRQEQKAAPVQEQQPNHDDGTKFRVDPYEMARRHDCVIHRYFSNDSLNTHVIIIRAPSRIVVAFSGTRDVTNWGVNANVNRAVLDEHLARFEYVLSNEDDEDGTQELISGVKYCVREGEQSSEELEKGKGMINSQEPQGGGGERRSRRARFEEDRKLSLDSSRRRSPTFRRSQSEDRVPVYRRDPRHAEDPLLGRKYSKYGAVHDADTPGRRLRHGRRGVTWDDLMLIRDRHRVGQMASTFRHELMTFGQPKVHKGFMTAYLSLRKQVLGALVELYGGDVRGTVKGAGVKHWGIAKGLPLFFTGHSLGGAMGMFGAYEAARYFKRIGIARRQDVACTTFACPRVGNEAFKMRYERLVETHWRFEFASDPIPKMSTTVLNYVPAGVQVLIDQSGMLLIDPSLIEVQWWGRLSNPYRDYKLHTRAAYCMGLRTYCRNYRNGEDDLDDKFWEFPIRAQTRGMFGQP